MIKSIIYKIRIRMIMKLDNASGDRLRGFYEKKNNITIGRYTYGYNVSEIAPGTTIGSFCSIASGVKIGLMNHPMEYVSTSPFLYYRSRGFVSEDRSTEQKKPPLIEDDVWVGNNAIILPGVVVHKGAVIGAGSVVTKDVPPYSVVGGGAGKIY